MAPSRIMFIRHGEKPDTNIAGVLPSGENDKHSLAVRGWQRAGGIAQFFGRVGGDATRRPAAIFSSGVTPDSHSKRESQTITPLVSLLLEHSAVQYRDGYEETDFTGLVKDVMQANGIVLICWHHNKIRKIIQAIPKAPDVPHEWPEDRFDVVWILDADKDGWTFSQLPMQLLSGDRNTTI